MNEIWHNFPSGNSLDAYIRRKSDDKIFDESDGGNTFEDQNDANVLNYDVPLTDHGSDYYSVDFPAVITTATDYRVAIAKRSGGSAAIGDLRVAQGEMHWGGTTEINTLTLSRQGSRVLNVYPEAT